MLGPLLICGGAIAYTDWTLYYLVLPQALYIQEFASCMLSLICLVSSNLGLQLHMILSMEQLLYLMMLPHESHKTTYNIEHGEINPHNELKTGTKPDTEDQQEDYETLPDAQADEAQEDYETIPGTKLDSVRNSAEEEHYTYMEGAGNISEIQNTSEEQDVEELYEYINEN